MKAFYVTVWDIFMIGTQINFVVDTDDIPGLVLSYKGKESFETLKNNIQIGQRILVGSSSR